MWEAVAAVATSIGVFGGIVGALIKFGFRQQLKLEEARQETARAQKEAVESEKKVYELSLSETMKEFNSLRAQVNGKVTLYIAKMTEIQTEIHAVTDECEKYRDELSKLNGIFKDYVDRVDSRITNLEKRTDDFGKVILKTEQKT